MYYIKLKCLFKTTPVCSHIYICTHIYISPTPTNHKCMFAVLLVQAQVYGNYAPLIILSTKLTNRRVYYNRTPLGNAQ